MGKVDIRHLLGRLRRKLSFGRAASTPGVEAHSSKALGGGAEAAGSAPQKKAVPAGDKAAVDRIVESALFDHEWYAAQRGRTASRRVAARHYLTKGHTKGFSPHPLFDPAFFASELGQELPDEKSPLLVYLNRKSLRSKVAVHPLFDLGGYISRHPASIGHADGPVGHYVEFGARNLALPNDWYVPDLSEEPHGLIDWIRSRSTNWRRLQGLALDQWARIPEPLAREFASLHPNLRPEIDHKSDSPLVSVVVRSGLDADVLTTTLQSVAEQTINSWELVVLDEGSPSQLEALVRSAVGGAAVVTIPVDRHVRAEQLNAGAANASGDFITWIEPGETWAPDRLARTIALCQQENTLGTYDGIARITEKDVQQFCDRRVSQAHLKHGWNLILSRLVVRRSVVDDLDGFDNSTPGGSADDFTQRLYLRGELSWCPVIGVHRDVAKHFKATRLSPRFRPLPDHEFIATWSDVARNKNFLPWAATRCHVSGRVSVLIPTYDDWQLTQAAVEAVCLDADKAGSDVEVIVLNNGCDQLTSLVLDSFSDRWPRVNVVHSPVNLGFALGNNLALSHATGELVVFLNNDTLVHDDWLTPLVSTMADPRVRGAQSLLLFPSGTIQSAGIAFPTSGGLPHEFLKGLPADDGAHASELNFNALTGAALMMRLEELRQLRGFDPVFRNGLEDVDLCLRAVKEQGGSFRVLPSSRVTHFESQSVGRHKASLTNRTLYLDRWADAAPKDDETLWASAGFEVTGHRVLSVVAEDRRICTPVPQISRRRSTIVNGGRPSFRWAIKNPAPAGVEGEGWGDTYFARQLAEALRRLGQQVVIDHKPEYYRATGYLDDVVVVLRGLTPFRPAFGQITLGWVISHPDMLSWGEAKRYDRLFAASGPWADRMAREWRLQIDTLLQATDPNFFNPDRAMPDTGHPAVFVGSSRLQQRPVVQYAVAAGVPLSVFGRDWSGYVPDTFVRAEFAPNEELGAMYRAASLVLNDHWEDMRSAGFLSNRLFDAVASGARVISDHVEGLDDLFGRSVQAVGSPADVARIAAAHALDEIFGDDSERRSVAERVAKEHSFDARALQLLETVIEMRQRQV